MTVGTRETPAHAQPHTRLVPPLGGFNLTAPDWKCVACCGIAGP